MATYDLSINNPQNDAELVVVLKTWLNAVGAANPRALLDTSTGFDRATDAALRVYQRQHNLPSTGVCRIRTWHSLTRQINRQRRAELTNLPMRQWLANLLNGVTVIERGIHVDEDLFFTMFAVEFGSMNDDQRAGLRQLLGFIAEDPEMHNVQWAAYLLATAKHETTHKLQPIDETGKGSGHRGKKKNGKDDYGVPVTIIGGDGEPLKDGRGNAIQHVFYGRGYVQITWADNYKKMGQRLGYGDDLYYNPERVKDPKTAYQIASLGMREGLFYGGNKLRDHITYESFDYFKARDIINGDKNDHLSGEKNKVEGNKIGNLIKDMALTFEAMLRACNGNR